MQLAFVPPAASPIRRQYLALKHQHPDAILFFQLGDFYETFEDDARLVAEVCDVALTSREMGRGERVPMAGVPVHAVDAYLARLVERGYHIALCQQMEDPPTAARAGSPVVRREVTRVITPGTLVEPTLLSVNRPNYLAAVAVERGRIGLAYTDISTGEFACTEIDGRDHLEIARAEMWRLQPAECLVADEVTRALAPDTTSATLDPDLFAETNPERTLCGQFGVASLGALGLDDWRVAARAAAAVLRYVERTQKRAEAAVERLQVYDARGHMVLDPATREQLELSRGARGRREGSLLGLLDRTRTPMGARLLAVWIGHPLLDREAIESRLDGVEALVREVAPRSRAQDLLGRAPDLERLAARAAQRLLTPRECLSLAAGLEVAAQLQQALEGAAAPLASLAGRLDPPLDLVEDVRSTLADDPPAAFGEGMIRRGCVPELDDLRSHSSDGRRWLVDLERQERARTGVKNLKVGYNRVFGYYLEASSAALGQALDYYRQQETGAATVAQVLEQLGYQRRQTLTSAERFVTPELRDHEVRQARSAARMVDLEREAFQALGGRVASHAPRLLATAAAIAELDALASYAQVAQERRYVRPGVVEEPETQIVGGRHPTVEAALGWDAYIPADVELSGGRGDGQMGRRVDDGNERGGDVDTPGYEAPAQAAPTTGGALAPSDEADPSVILLTGPNMAGKTTYGRMALLVTLMAQCGSYVPAERARIGLADRIFVRSGAGDDIAGGQSTFMVEMTETAVILRSATQRSLAFFDEVGRGTSTYDGMAIARAIVEYLAHPDRRCRTIFSTHYHELAALENEQSPVRNYRMDVQESADRVWFTYRVVRGSADRSYGVHVARLAGLPSEVVARAHQVLAELEAGVGRPAAKKAPAASPILPEVVHELADVDVNQMTPVEALAKLERLRTQAEELIGERPKRGRRRKP